MKAQYVKYRARILAAKLGRIAGWHEEEKGERAFFYLPSFNLPPIFSPTNQSNLRKSAHMDNEALNSLDLLF